MNLSKKDILILRNLHGAKMPGYTDLSIRTGLPESTVRYRVERMEKGGVIKGYSAIVDPQLLDLHSAIVIGDNIPSKGLYFNTAGNVERVSIILDEYHRLYNNSIKKLRDEAEVKEILPVIKTTIPITTWSLEEILEGL